MSDYSEKFAGKLKPFLSDKVFTVSEFIGLVNGILEPLKLCGVVVRGEIGEDIYRDRKRGWMIVNLIDQKGAQINCFVPRYVAERAGVELKSGMEIKITGHPKLLENKGRFSFQVSRIGLVGEGDLKKQFEILKKRLKEEGFFDPKKKKEIPLFPQKIGLITSKGSDAEKDFLTHLEDYGFSIYAFDSKVEGDSAIDQLLSGIEVLNKNFSDLEAIVITRGGGSWESLQAFNSEELVKAVFSSKVPIISAVGHENDITLADLVSDLRVSTPTDAGKRLSKNWQEGEKRVESIEKNISSATGKMITQADRKLSDFRSFFGRKVRDTIRNSQRNLEFLFSGITDKMKRRVEKFYNLEDLFNSNRVKLRNLIKAEEERAERKKVELVKSSIRWQKSIERKISEEEKKIGLASPELKLIQGYSITRSEGKVIKRASELTVGDDLETQFKDGKVISKINKK